MKKTSHMYKATLMDGRADMPLYIAADGRRVLRHSFYSFFKSEALAMAKRYLDPATAQGACLRIELSRVVTDLRTGEQSSADLGEYEYYQGARFKQWRWHDMNKNYEERLDDEEDA